MSLIEAWAEWKAWFASLSPEFVFLLALPFVVALAAFLRGWLARPRGGAAARGAQPAAGGGRDPNLAA